MASSRIRANGSWEFTVKRKGLLDKPIFLTFATKEEGVTYCRALEKLLDRGIIPAEFQSHKPITATIADAVREYCMAVHITDDDAVILNRLSADIGTVELVAIKYAWAEIWVSSLRAQGGAPGTIRKKVGALARCLDWVLRREDTLLASNPLRVLPKRYSTTATGTKDVERDRRLQEGEEARILAVIDGYVPEGRQRAVVAENREAWRLLFILAIETAMRLRETYTLTRGQIDLDARTVFLDKTKNGDSRQVPLSSVAVSVIKDYLTTHPADNLFPFWDGSFEAKALRATSNRLSHQWAAIAELAGCDDLRFHDLRREATSRIFERTDLDYLEVAKVTGHRNPRVLMRYARLKGTDLAKRLW
ncbi:MAG: site-specific integrase [Sideroxydans sp.]|nr:site-specific integrase [Sideroxydans sp.]